MNKFVDPETFNLHMLLESDGSIGVCIGDDGVFLVDDRFAPLKKKFTSAIGKIIDKDIRSVTNTQWHFGHVCGNENLGEMGAVIVAHENVRNRMSTD